MKTIPEEEEIKGEKWELENRQKKTITRWATWLTYTTSYEKFLRTRKLKRGMVS